MKIIITEKQYNKLTEDKLQKLCYTVWNQQKKRGEEPYIDDIIYDITDIRKNSNEDFQIIRPIWYRYNGGFNNLFEKLKNEIDEKIFDLTSLTKLGEWLETNFKNNSSFPEAPLEMDFRNLEFCKWNGIDYKNSGYTSKSMFFENVYEEEKEIN